MSVWIWILIAAVVAAAVAAAIVAGSKSRRRRTARLKEQFGSEYDRTVFEAGDQNAAEKELVARERQHKKLDIVPLSPESHRKYAEAWRGVQTAFVDNPASAVGEADRLVTLVMRERGYPVDDFDRRIADVSVDHPAVAQNYRAAHSIHLSQRERDIDTEEQRQALVHYRALFEKLLETTPDHQTPQEASHDHPAPRR